MSFFRVAILNWNQLPQASQKGATFNQLLLLFRLGSPALSSSELSSLCRRVWRRAIHFFLLLICFCGSQSQAGFYCETSLARYWLV